MADEIQDAAAGWNPLPGIDGPAEKLEFDTLDSLDELAHPIRSRIMRHLKEPNTIAELARALDMPVTRLYHHINRLERAGLIRVVATRKVAAVTERRYQVVALSMGFASKFLDSQDPAQVATAIGSIFDMAKLGLQQQIAAGALTFDEADPTVLSFGRLALTADRLTELGSRLTALIDEFTSDPSSDDPDASKVVLFIASYPESD